MARGEGSGKTIVTGVASTSSTGSSAKPSTGDSSGLAAGTPGEVIIRKCETLEDMQSCFALQKEVWQFSDAELVPLRMFVVAAKIGGQVVGAFVPVTSSEMTADKGKGKRKNGTSNEEGENEKHLIAFALAFPAMRNGHFYLHSQMLAVRSQYRNGGLGRRMKLYQREDALARGFELMEWTFDPLEIKNSYLNIEKLGAIARRYNVNQYGVTSSPLQGGLPSDRLVAEWWMRSKRVDAVLAGAPVPKFECRMHIDVPSEIYEWKTAATTRARALAVQKENRPRFESAFAAGLSILGYERGPNGNGRFLLGKWDEHLRY